MKSVIGLLKVATIILWNLGLSMTTSTKYNCALEKNFVKKKERLPNSVIP